MRSDSADSHPTNIGKPQHIGLNPSDTIPHPNIVLSDDDDDEEEEETGSIPHVPNQNLDKLPVPADLQHQQRQEHPSHFDQPSTVVQTDQPSFSDEEERPRQRGFQRTITQIAQLTDSWTVPGDIHTTDDVKRHVITVSKDTTISEAEKNRRRQILHSALFLKHQQQNGVQFQKKMEQEAACATTSNVEDPETGQLLLGCEHYPRNCKLLADCCKSWVVCRHCHDQQDLGHTMTRFDTKSIMCMLCNLEQPVSNKCINPACAIQFARYFCAKCKFFDGTPGKNIYHCDHCGICRVGEGLGHDNFHCSNCDACVSLKYEKNHRCLKRSLDAHCPVCKHYLFTSTKPVVFMKCGHTMHAHCFDEYISSYYTCPLCHKSLTNMTSYYNQIDQVVQRQTLPEEIRCRRAEILCHDCGGKCETQFHYLHLKCILCNSYNTRLIRTFDLPNPSTSAVTSLRPSGREPTVPVDSYANEYVDDENDSGDEVSEDEVSEDEVCEDEVCEDVIPDHRVEQEVSESLLGTETIGTDENVQNSGRIEIVQTAGNEVIGVEIAEEKATKTNDDEVEKSGSQSQNRNAQEQGEARPSIMQEGPSSGMDYPSKKRNRQVVNHRSVRFRPEHVGVQGQEGETQSTNVERNTDGPDSGTSQGRAVTPLLTQQEREWASWGGTSRENAVNQDLSTNCMLPDHDEEEEVEEVMELEEFVTLHGSTFRREAPNSSKQKSANGAEKESVDITCSDGKISKSLNDGGGSSPR